MLSIRKIVCSTDFSPLSIEGVKYGAELAAQFNCQLLVTHVVPPLDDYPGVFLSADQINRAVISEAVAHLRDFIKAHVPSNIEALPCVKCGDAAAGVLEVADEEHADLIVISTHGRTGWRHLVLGSVAERILRQAKCPVLSVRHAPEKEVNDND